MLKLWVCLIFFNCIPALLKYKVLLIILFTGIANPLVGKGSLEGSCPSGRAYRAKLNYPKSQREPFCLLRAHAGWTTEAKDMPSLSPIWHFPRSDWVNWVCSGLVGKSLHGEWWNKIHWMVNFCVPVLATTLCLPVYSTWILQGLQSYFKFNSFILFKKQIWF